MARRIATECPGLRLRQASRVVAKIYDDELRPTGLQLSQLPVLVALALFGESGAPMNALARAVVMDRTTLTRNVRPLEKAGFLRVARSPDDARARVVLLTRAGERKLEEAFPLWESGMKRVRAAMGTTALAALHERLGDAIAMRETA
ncbi:MAG TPA: MarR family winged helix-turn-helix transcriptional regulator [Polyangiaceae bacterium]|nr:MarR family winged helix-turn-helix transcriptional regulator [Polyangiaceae bacterium]